MKVRELFKGQAVQVSGDDVSVTGLVYDSRKVQPGVLFAALSGAASDGHDYIPKAIELGATAILCEREVETGQIPRVVAPDARHALALAAREFFDDPGSRLKTVGITGTNGKTTTAYLVGGMLEAAGVPTGIVGTLGAVFKGEIRETGLTTPESVPLLGLLNEMVDADVRAAVMEVSSHALLQHRAAGVGFDVGVFTNLTQDHLDYHKSLEDYFEAKALLLETHLKAGGVGVLNLDDPKVATLWGESTIGFSQSSSTGASVYLKSSELSSERTVLRIETPKGELEVRSALVGDFNVQNILAAVSVGIALELDLEAISCGLGAVEAVPGRLERVFVEGAEEQPLVLVDYAHTPDALEKALKAVRQITTGRLIVVFGCGGDRDSSKRALMGRVCALHSDWAVVTSDNPRSEDPGLIVEEILVGLKKSDAVVGANSNDGGYLVELDRALAIAIAIESAVEGDCVLIAGKGHEDYQIIGDSKIHFDDCEEALVVLRQRAERS